MATKKHKTNIYHTDERWPRVAERVRPAQFQGEDPLEIREAVRAELDKLGRKQQKKRAKYPPASISKGKGKRKRWVVNPDFTDRMRKEMHKTAFTAEQVRAGLVK